MIIGDPAVVNGRQLGRRRDGLDRPELAIVAAEERAATSGTPKWAEGQRQCFDRRWACRRLLVDQESAFFVDAANEAATQQPLRILDEEPRFLGC